VRALVLESASPGIEDDRERSRRAQTDDALAERILRDGVPAFVEEWEHQPLLALADHVPDHVRAAQRAERLLNNPPGLANSLRGMGAGRQTPLWSRLGALRMPVSLVVGAHDTRYRQIAARMQLVLAHAEINVVEAAGHTVHVDQAFEFARLVAGAFASEGVRQTAHFQEIDTTRHTLLY